MSDASALGSTTGNRELGAVVGNLVGPPTFLSQEGVCVHPDRAKPKASIRAINTPQDRQGKPRAPGPGSGATAKGKSFDTEVEEWLAGRMWAWYYISRFHRLRLLLTNIKFFRSLRLKIAVWVNCYV